MNIKRSDIDVLADVKHQKGCSQGWFMTFVRCPECRKTMWSNKKKLYCPTCCIEKEIKR